jgi:hypothetical protein
MDAAGPTNDFKCLDGIRKCSNFSDQSFSAKMSAVNAGACFGSARKCLPTNYVPPGVPNRGSLNYATKVKGDPTGQRSDRDNCRAGPVSRFQDTSGHRQRCSDKTLLPIANIPRNSQRQVASGNAIDQALSADRFHPSIFEDVVTIAQTSEQSIAMSAA